eukprot:26730-Rhodomonas_salina.2
MRPVAALTLALFALQYATAFSPLLSFSPRVSNRMAARSSFVTPVTSAPLAARRTALNLDMAATVPKIIQGGMGVQVRNLRPQNSAL